MFALRTRLAFVCSLLFLAGAPAAHAQWAVVDVGAIVQLVQQVQTLRQQLSTAKDQLSQARTEFDSMTGGRGMERLLGATVRNYLPPDWAELDRVLHGANATYGTLSASLQSAINANAVLSANEVAALSTMERSQLETARRSAALLQVTARQALSTTSGRFASLQQLIEAIPAAGDQKAILDLQARIGAEQSMLQNEQTKLQVLFQAAQAEDRANRQRAREQVIAGHGLFASRFQPSP
jgi:type IV secretion system protein VirB5